MERGAVKRLLGLLKKLPGGRGGPPARSGGRVPPRPSGGEVVEKLANELQVVAFAADRRLDDRDDDLLDLDDHDLAHGDDRSFGAVLAKRYHLDLIDPDQDGLPGLNGDDLCILDLVFVVLDLLYERRRRGVNLAS